MNVIFFDVDGVFNTIRQYRLYGENFVDISKIQLFVNLVKETNSHAVLSSGWRKEPESKMKIYNVFENMGIKIYDSTPIFDHMMDRSEEIQSWLKHHVVNNFAIIDDDTRANIQGHFFQVNENIGITEEICSNVKNYLSNCTFGCGRNEIQ